MEVHETAKTFRREQNIRPRRRQFRLEWNCLGRGNETADGCPKLEESDKCTGEKKWIRPVRKVFWGCPKSDWWHSIQDNRYQTRLPGDVGSSDKDAELCSGLRLFGLHIWPERSEHIGKCPLLFAAKQKNRKLQANFEDLTAGLHIQAGSAINKFGLLTRDGGRPTKLSTRQQQYAAKDRGQMHSWTSTHNTSCKRTCPSEGKVFCIEHRLSGCPNFQNPKWKDAGARQKMPRPLYFLEWVALDKIPRQCKHLPKQSLRIALPG